MATQPRTSRRKAAAPPPPPPPRNGSNGANGHAKAQWSDSLENVVSGMGTERDKLRNTKWTLLHMDRAQLDAAYRGDWVARKACDIPADDATREWRSWLSENKDIEKIEQLERDLMLQQKMNLAMQMARLYGGAGLLIGADQGKLEEPLEPEKIGVGGLKFVHAVTRYDIVNGGQIIWDITSPWYGLPEFYVRAQGGQERIHPSRVVRFIGRNIPDLNVSEGWGDSILQAIQDALLAAGMVTMGGAQLIQEIKMDIIKIPELSANISNKKYAQRLLARFGVASVAKSLYNILLLDKEEDWERIVANLAGLPDTLKMYLLIVSGAADIPVTRFLGQSPAGLNTTGEGDLRNYYDNVRSRQNNLITPAMKLLDECIIRSAVGATTPGDIIFRWNPLWQMDDTTAATVAKSKADTFQIDLNSGLIPDEVLRDARINQLIEDNVYPGLEQILEDYGPLPDPEEAPEPGAMIGPDGKPIQPDDPRHPANQPPEPAANENEPPPAKAIGDMVARVRDARKKKRLPYQFTDATPRPLYVYRKVTNGAALLAWARNAGITELQNASELHVTIMYSSKAVDWGKAASLYTHGMNGEDDGTLTVPPGGMRMIDRFDGNALVLLFASSELCWRHESIKYCCECETNYDTYQPHVTLAYPTVQFDPRVFDAYTGPIELGIELWEEAKPYEPPNVAG